MRKKPFKNALSKPRLGCELYVVRVVSWLTSFSCAFSVFVYVNIPTYRLRCGTLDDIWVSGSFLPLRIDRITKKRSEEILSGII
jgi:hypothetical protein